MTTVIVGLKDFAKELEDFTESTLKKQQFAVGSGLLKSLPTLVRNSPIDTGLYAQSWDFTIDEKSAILGNFAPHAPIIESGARPFTPPIGPLLRWAKRVLQDPSQPPDFSSDVWRLAKGTQKKIAEKGMKPRHILENALPEIIDNIRRELDRVNI